MQKEKERTREGKKKEGRERREEKKGERIGISMNYLVEGHEEGNEIDEAQGT